MECSFKRIRITCRSTLYIKKFPMMFCSLRSFKDNFHSLKHKCVKELQASDFSFWLNYFNQEIFPPSLSLSRSPTACFCCQRGLCFARQSVLCQCVSACVMREDRNLSVFLLRSDSAVCCGDSPSLCFDV